MEIRHNNLVVATVRGFDLYTELKLLPNGVYQVTDGFNGAEFTVFEGRILPEY